MMMREFYTYYSSVLRGLGDTSWPLRSRDDFDRLMEDDKAIRQEATLIIQKKSRLYANQRRKVMHKFATLKKEEVSGN